MPIRRARMSDLLDMQATNIINLGENYAMKYYLYHAFSWSQLMHLYEDYNGKMNGYVMAKMEEEGETGDIPEHGHITSVATNRPARKLGIATTLMRQTEKQVKQVFNGRYIALHVRNTNDPAIRLYQDTLGYRVHAIDQKYYADDEDAYEMKYVFGGDPYGAKVMRISRNYNHDGILEWPEKNPDGKLKFDSYLMTQIREERLQAEKEKKAKEAPNEEEKPAPARRGGNKRRGR
eukprot:TRINITY_DN1492_c0_g1_i2.p1 TRINITY_DN1492_c0_g1~~TRINITY_DN1492_c0_g1_i2.p1  ORF type:complete len:234 (+),score=49.60 TRINITY_DN1492_c0_g1_i2:54-755(+)